MAPQLNHLHRELPASVRKVDILGSWDNFKEAYPLERDRQAGAGHWRGCHNFKNITCDGDSLDPAMRRNGALKMGGTYWYYYRLNGEVEHHDPIQPSTTACPLLPGQEVNILEVPSESQGRLRDLRETDVFTLDPNAKYSLRKPSVRPKPTSIPSDTLSAKSVPSDFPALERQKPRVGTSAPPPTATLQRRDEEPPTTTQGLCIAFPTSSSLMTKIFKLRGSRSASEVDGNMSGPRHGGLQSIWRRSTKDEEKRRATVKSSRGDPSGSRVGAAQAAHGAPPAPNSAIDQVLAGHRSHTIASRSTTRSNLHSARHVLSEDVLHDSLMRRSSTGLKPSLPTSSHVATDGPLDGSTHLRASATTSTLAALIDRANSRQRESYEDSLPRPGKSTKSDSGSIRAGSPFVLPLHPTHQPIEPRGVARSQPSPVPRVARSARPPSLLRDNRHALESFYHSSPTHDGQLSPHHLSQPESPSVRDFEEAWESASQSQPPSYSTPCETPPILPNPILGAQFDLLPMPQLPGPGFQGYSLPEAQHTSTLTLQKLPSNKFSESQLRPSSRESRRFVESWDDGSDQRHLTALDELVDDLGHLGRIIT
ncbi:MAG: hypothetical protein Q9169_005403 [Polycauliona sp. 2 TL-2023]